MKYGKHTTIVLGKMFEMVGIKYSDKKTEHEDWFLKKEWTEDVQHDFTKWLTDYLYDNVEARKEIMRYPRKSKKLCNDSAMFFVFNYGWKTKFGNRKSAL